MPSSAEPFDGVLTEKEWSKARDKTGLTGSLTEKVSMGKELTLFHKTKDEAAATHLLAKIGIYEQALKTKHSKDKYYAKLLKLVTEQKEAVQVGINILKNGPVIADLRKRLTKLTTGWADRVKNDTQSGASEKAFRDRLKGIRDRVTALIEEVPEGSFILNPTTVEKVVHVEKDWEQFKADLHTEKTQDDDDDEEGNEGGATTPAGKYWEKTMVPYMTGLINRALSKHPDLMLKGQPAQVIAGLLGGVRQKFEQTYDVYKIKPFQDHKPNPDDKTTTEAVNTAWTLLATAAQAASDKKADTEWFHYAPVPEKTGGGGEKKIAFTGTGPEQFDDQKAYGSLLMRLSALKADAGAAAKFLGDKKQLSAIFPYEMSYGKHEAVQTPSVVNLLGDLGNALFNEITNLRRDLRGQPPAIESARTRFGQLEQTVNGLHLPRHGETVQKAVRLFILEPLKQEITAVAGK
ncbi:hypothetical protein CfE428DRAFT_3761 [Chthoniobacter flavus Ellin428]|uniref:Uncharacterized protein n=1 Tax=Chthoniobacter flavus Ellin428 TaxID=497964 RepID=B4D4C3_9BACT|nr:hypothetical protein [Chthoniobacter flavus]EDY18724.1 hypothetical protein CfE428DRAFT_3761 [Chthoniobacter flavus Ellin428]TCO89036.1 hypothetical protein EV701_11570 [Chthoniobacter flavus]